MAETKGNREERVTEELKGAEEGSFHFYRAKSIGRPAGSPVRAILWRPRRGKRVKSRKAMEKGRKNV